ncbi:hypothetical protein [Tenacibaculum sp. 190524A05c]|uniref:hypothetical protein n=1 Tax=Tenacibaculum platacis TaxID=3137852 RepID=UPI0031FAD426
MNSKIKEIINKIRKLRDENSGFIIINELDKTNLSPVQKIHVLKETLEINGSEAQSMFLKRYKSRVTDELLNVFLEKDEEE